MALSETAQLLVNLVMKDGVSGPAKTASGGIGSLGKAVLGVAGAAGFGALTKGALEAESAQGKFMAATGGSREEAKKFVSDMDGLAGTAGAVGKSFDEITQAGIDVANQFGTTGQDTQDLTGYFLDFAKASNQDVHGAILGLNDTLTAYGVPLQDSKGYMDELIASHQKFGTDIGPETISTLQNIGPALQTLGGNLDDGIGLMNAFETAGLNSNQAMKDLTGVIKNFPPGTTLNDVITKLGAIEDPTKRAQSAIEIFGPKIGPGLAAIIKPGMTSLDDFKVSMDDAKGATTDAANNMQTSGDKIRGMFDKITAGAREVGQQFGPAITGLASLGSLAAPMAGKFKDLLGSLLTKILPQATATGLATGTAMAEGEAEGAAGAGAIKTIGAKIAAMSVPLSASGTTVGTAVGGAISAGIAGAVVVGGAGFIAFGPAIFQHLMGTDTTSQIAAAGKQLADQFAGHYSTEIQSQYATVVAAAMQQAYDRGVRGPAGVQAGVDAGNAFLQGFADPVEQANLAGIMAHNLSEHQDEVAGAGADAGTTLANSTIKTITGFGTQGMRAALAGFIAPPAAEAGRAAGHALAMGLNQSLPDVHDQWKQFVDDQKNALDPMTEISWLQGRLSGDKLAAALNSKNPLTRAAAEDMRDKMQAELAQLQTLMHTDGVNAGNSLGDGINASTPGAVDQARDLKNKVNSQLAQIQNRINIRVTRSNNSGGASDTGGVDTRATGGPVAGGGIYEVNERGDPETLTIGGRNFLLMGNQSGYVKPMGGPTGSGWGGGVQPIVNVYITARDIENVGSHRRVLQGSGAGFR